MKAKDAKAVALLCEALEELPRARHQLSTKPGKYWDCVHLELSASQRQDGVGQGSDHYFDVPPRAGRMILDAARKIILAELKRMGVTVSSTSRTTEAT